jgi:hypothetical protein
VVRRALPLLLLVGLWTAAPAHAQATSILFVVATPAETTIDVSGSDSAGTARVQISVPAGFGLDVGRPVGAVVGRAVLDLASAAAPDGEGSLLQGDVVVADPSSYAGNARLAACASGTHATVWRVEPLGIPIFVDGASGPDAALGGYELRACLDLPPGLSFRDLELDLLRAVVPPTLPGMYVWHALLTPLTAAGAVDEGATWEVRALLPWPAVLSLHARAGKAKGRYLLSGRLVLAGKPRGGATIRLLRLSPGNEGGSDITITLVRPRTAETDRSGRFRIAVRVQRPADFFALWFPFPRDRCSSPSTAPGGCRSESTSPALSRPVIVRP